ncbi:MAG: sulfatase [Planctomycetota bacterium]|nr:sulfatase [Planctomycetota bacterium]
MSDRPNVIVLVSDTFRPDHLGANGHPYCRTPELDAFVRSAVSFDGATVSSFPTIPMRTDWFTGRFSHPHHGWQPLDRAAFTLPKAFGLAGYTTQLLASTMHLLNGDFQRSFRHWDFLRGLEGDSPYSRLNQPLAALHADPRKTRHEYGSKSGSPALCDRSFHTNFRLRYEDEHHAQRLATNVCRWIEDNWKGGPFFLWVDSFDVHEPWFPPEHLWRSYDPDYEGEPMCHPNYSSAGHYAPAELKNLQARYAATCTLLSRAFGRILRTVEDAGLYENTIVLFMSDHGMYIGERGRTGKTLITPEASDCFPFHSELTRICWSMRLPAALGLKAAAPGTRFKQPIQAPDLLPTLLELCGLKAPSNVKLDGSSLAPLLRGDEEAPPRPVAVTASTCKTSLADGILNSRRPAVTDGTWTLLLSEPPEPLAPKLFHVAEDPAQQRDAFREHRDEAVRLHGLMLAFLKEKGAPAEALERLGRTNVGLA